MSRRSKLPGIDANRSWKNKVVGSLYVSLAFVLALIVIGAALGPVEDPGTADAETATTTVEDLETTQAQPQTTVETTQPAQTTTAPSNEVTVEMMTTVIEGQGVHVENVMVSDAENYAQLDHHSSQATADGLAGEMGVVGGSWAGYVADNPNAPDELIVYVVDEDTGADIGHYIVNTDDARAFANDEISGETFGQRIIGTTVQY